MGVEGRIGFLLDGDDAARGQRLLATQHLCQPFGCHSINSNGATYLGAHGVLLASKQTPQQPFLFGRGRRGWRDVDGFLFLFIFRNDA